MLTLALETSGAAGSVALVDDAGCLDERRLELGLRHGQSLIPEIRRLLGDFGKSPRDCQLVAVSIGPGSFTGLRVGVVCAKTLAYAIGCQIAAVETLTAVAYNAPADVHELQVISNAQRNDVFLSRHRRESADRWKTVNGVSIMNIDQWAAELRPDDAVTGPGLVQFADVLRGRCRLLREDGWHPRGRWVAMLGRRLVAEGVHVNPWTLEPLYLRRSSAEDMWEARQPHNRPPPAAAGLP